jgi:hypothetical protein
MEPMTIVIYLGKAAVSKLIDVGIEKALGVQVQGATVGAWGEQMALAIFLGQSMIPEPTFEQKTEKRFRELDQQISGLRKDIDDLKNEMEGFKWQVQTLLYEAREEDLWQTMLQIENSSDTYYTLLRTLGAARDTLENRKQRSLNLADTILASPVVANIANARLALLGDNVGTGRERVRGLLEIWKQQALREADLGWSGERLMQIYNLLEAKFTRALLIQVKCARLLMEAHEARHTHDPSHKGAVDYFAEDFYPLLKTEVNGFRDLVESLAINLLPLPDRALATLTIPDEIAVLLASVDIYIAQALSGKITADAAPPGAGRKLEELPALAGCWGRVIVPGTRWIRRTPGSKEAARATITPQNGRSFTCKGRLEVRAVSYMPYEGQSGKKLHEGYQLYVSNEPRDMDKMLLAQFVPEEVLPSGLSGSLDVRIEDPSGGVLAQTKALVVPIPIDEKQSATVPYGTFTMSFTGGAQVRRR